MTQPSPDDTKCLRTRLRPSQRTLAVMLCLALVSVSAAVVMAQTASEPATRWENDSVGVTTASFQQQGVLDTDPQGSAVAVASDNTDVVLLDSGDGSVEWTYDHNETLISTTTDSQSVYFTSENSLLTALDKQSGSVEWSISPPTATGLVDYTDGKVFTVSGFSDIAAYDASDGSTAWTRSTVSGGALSMTASPAGDAVYVTSPETLYALDPDTGDEMWNVSFADSVTSGGRLSVAVQGDGSVAYVAANSPDGSSPDLFSVDTSAQSVLWSRATDRGSGDNGNHRPVSVSDDGGVLYVGGLVDGNTIQVRSASNGLLDRSWSGQYHTIDDGPDGSTLYAVRTDGTERAIAINTGGGNELAGTVTDQRNQAVDGVTIIANGSNANASTTTAEDGSYSLTLVNGTYDVTAEKEGYISDNATLTIDGDATQDFTLIEESAALSVKARHFMEHGESTPYSVTYGEIDSSGNFVRSDVTNQTTATSNNSTVVTVNTITQELTATSDTSINDQTYVTFNYTNSEGETFSRQHNVTVANATVDNLDILPPVTKFTATLADKTMQAILIATGVAVVAAIIAGAFSGIAAFTVIMSMGWVMGIVDDGTIIVVVLTAMFIGMNVAGNVDYTVQR